jgi:F0F1-type ATP synthase membrane subunit c/vacuolar-type H+-ATPase subunit K
MRRIPIAAAIAAAAVLAPAGAQGASGNAYLRGFACHRALDPSKRTVTVTAVMSALAGAPHLQMRFQLQDRTTHGTTLIHGGDLGQWISPSSPTLGQHSSDQWVVNHPVTGVPVPGSYRFKVFFRWIGQGGQVIGQTQKTTETCRQPDLRPNLYVRLQSAQAVGSGNQYTVQVGNSGMTGATGVELQFSPGGLAPAVLKTIARLPAHQSVERSFVGPACTSSSAPATIAVDPNDLIDVVSRADNSITVPCPSG